VGLNLTEPQKLAHRVRVAPHIFYLGIISSQCGTWIFLNTPPHAHHFWTWCVDNTQNVKSHQVDSHFSSIRQKNLRINFEMIQNLILTPTKQCYCVIHIELRIEKQLNK